MIGGADVLGADFERVEGADFGVLVGAPGRRDPDRPIIGEIAAGIVDEVAEADPAGQAEVGRQRILPIQLNPILKSAMRDRRQQRLGTGGPQRQLDDPGRRGEWITLRGQPDPHCRSGEQSRIADEQPAQIQAVEADVAGRARTEAADLVGAVEADLLIADAGSEGIVSGGDRILARALRPRRGARAPARKGSRPWF